MKWKWIKFFVIHYYYRQPCRHWFTLNVYNKKKAKDLSNRNVECSRINECKRIKRSWKWMFITLIPVAESDEKTGRLTKKKFARRSLNLFLFLTFYSILRRLFYFIFIRTICRDIFFVSFFIFFPVKDEIDIDLKVSKYNIDFVFFSSFIELKVNKQQMKVYIFLLRHLVKGFDINFLVIPKKIQNE